MLPTRPYWKPIVETGEGSFRASKFSGMPFLPEGEEWPRCGHCNQPMQLFLQLSSLDLPPEFPHPWEGLLQLFYCTNDDDDCSIACQAYEAFPKSTKRSSLTRIIPLPTTIDWCLPREKSPVRDAFPVSLIKGWEQGEDFPHYEDLSDAGIDVDDEYAEEHMPEGGEKLGGWPYWSQGAEYPSCPQCQSKMHLLFQIDSETNLPYMFGDVGVGHITQCPNHPSVVGFGWACS